MLNFIRNKILDQASDGGDAGGAAPESKAPATAAQGAAPDNKAIEADGDKFDELGYEKDSSPQPGAEKPEGKKPEAKPPTDEPIKEPATGYGEKPPVVEEIVEEKKPEPPAIDAELGFEVKIEGAAKEEIQKITDFAKKNKLSKEQVAAYAELRKGEIAQYNAAVLKAQNDAKLEVARTRANWDKELRTDPDFGGDKFGANVKMTEKVLKDFMPNTKKMLTERGSMLPPYVMRDLAKMAEHLYSGDKFVQGDPPAPPKASEDKDAFLGEMYV